MLTDILETKPKYFNTPEYHVGGKVHTELTAPRTSLFSCQIFSSFGVEAQNDAPVENLVRTQRALMNHFLNRGTEGDQSRTDWTTTRKHHDTLSVCG